MGRGLFGAMAMFYSVGAAASGGGSSLTPPAAIIGAVPQLNFSDVANTGGYLQNSAAAGTIVTDGAYFDGASWIPKDTGAVMLQMNGALAGFVMYVNTSLTPGTPFTPTMVYQYLGAGSNVDFAPPVGATGGVVVSGGSLPTTGDSLSITKTNIATKNWTAGTYNALAAQAASFNLQTSLSGTSIDGSFQIGTASNITHTHPSQAGAQEAFYSASVADDATAKFRIRNGTATDATFIPQISNIGSGTSIASIYEAVVTTDTGTNPTMVFNIGLAAGGAQATRPGWAWRNNSSDLSQMATDGSQWWVAAPNQLAAGAYVIGMRRTFTVTSGSVVGAMLEGWCNPAGASSATICGSYSYGSSSAANGQNFTGTTGLVGAFGLAQHRGTATATGIASIVAGANVNSGGGTVTNNYGLYVFAQTVGTNNYTLYGAGGLIDNVGTIRASGSTVPSTGVGLECGWSGSDSFARSYSRTGSSYQPLSLDGSTVALRPSGTAGFTASASVNTNAVPMALKSYTVATLPAASVGAGAIVYASDAGGNGPCIAMSNGTNWKRCDNTATTVV